MAVTDKAQLIWCMRLHSAVRTAFACTLIGITTLYGPSFITNTIKFTAFSYLTAMLIVSDAQLGHALKGFWHAFSATLQVVPVSMVARWLLVSPRGGGGGSLPVTMAALATGVAAFFVAVPESTHMTTKKIAFGQIVLVCTDVLVCCDHDRYSGKGFMRPVYVAASTGLGALASVVALLVPFPDLACYKVHKLCQAYAENAYEKMNLYITAYNAKDSKNKTELVSSQARPLSETGTKLLQSIRILQEGMRWEKPWSRSCNVSSKTLENIELAMRGLEYSLDSSPLLKVQKAEQEKISNKLQNMLIQLKRKIQLASDFSSSNPETEQDKELKERTSPAHEHIAQTHGEESDCFFFSCINMLLNSTTEISTSQVEVEEKGFTIKTWIMNLTNYERLQFAVKCSLSLSLSVLLGLIFDKANGCWAGLTIAISFVKGRQAVFTVANTRVQGTAIGSVYGVIGCFLFHYEQLRLLALLPWIVFTSLLRHSRMYGQTGGLSAAIAALLVLGRKDYGDPHEFGIARLTEVFIGISSYVFVELLLQQTRAATQAKTHLYLTLISLQDCTKQMWSLPQSQENKEVEEFAEYKKKHRNINDQVLELKMLVADADLEPNFWYSPFRTSCYQKLVESLSKVVDMLYFITYNLELLLRLSETRSLEREMKEHMSNKLEMLQGTLNPSLRYLQMSDSTKEQVDSQNATYVKFKDLEAGTLQNPENETTFKIIEDSEELKADEEDEDKKQHRERIVQCIGALQFCFSSLRQELDHIEICVKEILRWDNN